ncbi:DUF5683 domain-containing protein [Algoriphagus namhaensis]|uniref:DUF5683 domain-containing protein n=1 Tax=Algoriphagus namhaensis TaxID=915353 RepID=A0ABV8API3_9BACT
MGLLFFCFGINLNLKAQDDLIIEENNIETTTTLPKNPKKATILSAILPGAGQVYNEKAWKVPIIYGGIITDAYFIGFNNKRYQSFRDALFAFDEGEPNDFPTLNRDGLVRNVDYWRRNRDICILLMGAIYALNIIDANVDAHLSGFEISDDLALKVEPHMERFSANNNSLGVSLKLNFR